LTGAPKLRANSQQGRQRVSLVPARGEILVVVRPPEFPCTQRALDGLEREENILVQWGEQSVRGTPKIGNEEELGSQRARQLDRRTNPLVHTRHGVPTNGHLPHRGGLPREAGGLRSVLPVTNVCSIRDPRLLRRHTEESRYSVLLRLGHELQRCAGLV